jgi:hypothetical protein
MKHPNSQPSKRLVAKRRRKALRRKAVAVHRAADGTRRILRGIPAERRGSARRRARKQADGDSGA